MAVGDAHMFPGFLTSKLRQLSFQSHRLLFSHAFSKGARRKCAGNKVNLNQRSNLQPPGHESDTLTTEPSGRGFRFEPATSAAESVNPFPNKPWFLRVCSRSLLKTLWEKKKLLVTSNFFFSHSVFYHFRELSAIFIKIRIVVRKLSQFGRV